MVIERAELFIKPGQEEEFEAAIEQAKPLLEGAAGCTKVTVARGIESPSTYTLLLEWGAVDEHTAFAQTDEFKQFGGLVGGFFADAPNVEHFEPRG